MWEVMRCVLPYLVNATVEDWLTRVQSHCSLFLSLFQMQELEQRVTEADQRAENAEKQVVGQFSPF